MTKNNDENTNKLENQCDEPTLSADDSAGTDFILSAGTLVEGKYLIVESLGKGGMGVVYKVEQVLLKRPMALKTLKGSEFSESKIRRFHSEAKLLAKLDHPGLVRVQDFGFVNHVKPFLVMDFVQGRTLATELQTSGVISLERSIKIFLELCFALGYAHAQDVVHRDVKPSNIMLTAAELPEDEHVKVLDFGIAKLMHHGLNETEDLTRTGEVFGSPFYMSPEQCAGKPVDHRTDIYSVGCIMFEVLTGAPPFTGETALTTMMLHQSEKPLSLKEASMGREFPAEIEKLLAYMLEKDPDQRIQNMHEVSKVLIGFQKGLSGADLSKPPRGTIVLGKKAREIRRIEFVAYMVCALLAGCLVMLAMLFFNQQPQSNTTPIEAAPELPKGRWSSTSQDGKWKIFNFPKDYSLGRLSYGNHGTVNLDARGTQYIPVGVQLFFAPNNVFLAHPQFLRNFGPNDLANLEFKETGHCEKYGSKIMPLNTLSDDELIYCDKMTGLDSLSVKHCNVTDKGLSYIQNLPLKSLNVDDTDVTAEGIKKMHCLKQLRYLRAGNLKDGGSLIRALAGSTQMEQLHLSDSELTDEDMKELAKIPNLKDVDIAFNPGITDRGLPYIVQLKHLHTLCLEHCAVTLEGALKYLKYLPQRPRISTYKNSPEQLRVMETTWPRQ